MSRSVQHAAILAGTGVLSVSALANAQQKRAASLEDDARKKAEDEMHWRERDGQGFRRRGRPTED